MALMPKRKVDSVFVMEDNAGLMQSISTVLALPPREFFRSLVSVEFL